MPSFSRMATVTASTKRPPAISSGQRGAPATNITSLACTPIDPIGGREASEIRERLGLSTPHELLRTYVDNGLDIKSGDILVIGSKEYPIKGVEDWAWRTTTYRALLLEDLKR